MKMPSLATALCAFLLLLSSGAVSALAADGVPAVDLLDKGLRWKVGVERIVASRGGDRPMVVEAQIRNKADDDLQVQVRTLFYDADGLVLYSEPGNEAAWAGVILTAHEVYSYRARALSGAAKRFTIQVRYLHRPQNS